MCLKRRGGGGEAEEATEKGVFRIAVREDTVILLGKIYVTKT